MAKKEKLMTLEEFQEFRDMEIPPKRGTPAYRARQAAIREAKEAELDRSMDEGFRKATTKKAGGAVKSKSKSKSSASKRADGCAKKGKTRGKMI